MAMHREDRGRIETSEVPTRTSAIPGREDRGRIETGWNVGVLVVVGALLLGHASEARAVRPETAPAASPSSRQNSRSFRTTNFQVTSRHAHCSAAEIGKQCEALRESLQERWVPGRVTNQQDWSPICEIVIHANERDYLQEVGFAAAMTRGVCRIDMHHGRITRRRIDLWADSQSRELTALAHELTHVVLADSYITRRLPRWADEGIALAADHVDKKSLHRKSVRRAVQERTCPGLKETLARREYPQGQQRGIFYGQSLSLVEYLLELDEPGKVLEFVELGMDRGYDHAARQVYGLAGVSDLDRRWRSHLLADSGR